MKPVGRRLYSEKAMLEFEVKHFQGWQGAGCSYEWETGMEVKGH